MTRGVLTGAYLVLLYFIIDAWVRSGDGTSIPAIAFGVVGSILILIRLFKYIVLCVLFVINVGMVILGVYADQYGNLALITNLQFAALVAGLALVVIANIQETRKDSATYLALKAQEDAEAAKSAADRIATARREEREYAAEVARMKNASAKASGPGTLTGYEPAALQSIALDQHDRFFGNPGTGLEGSGFGDTRIRQGVTGEVNFAKALQKAGLHDRFASFWSVHMPDALTGASTALKTDIDCVILTGSKLWLVDVKNYQQGDVAWHVKENGNGTSHLFAVDNKTGGYVGKRDRSMTKNMRIADARFRQRLSAVGISLEVKPVVVMMPQADGLGQIGDIEYPGAVPLVGLPTLLADLQRDSRIRDDDDTQLVTTVLQSLLKDESGSAFIPDGHYGGDALDKDMNRVFGSRND